MHTHTVNATSELPVQLSKLDHPESLLPWQLESQPTACHGWGWYLCVTVAKRSAGILFVAELWKVAFGSPFKKRGH